MARMRWTSLSTRARTGLTSASLTTNPGSVTITDNATLSGSFSYTVSDGAPTNATDTANVTLTRVTGNAINGATGFFNSSRSEILIGGSGNDTIIGGGGNDTVNGGAGDDRIVWNVANPIFGFELSSDGHDIVDGGTTATSAGRDTGSDRFVVNGNNTTEAFAIYSNTDDWDNNAGNGIVSSAAHAGLTGLNANTEIVITRNGNVIAELSHIEEITVNTLDTTANNNDNLNAPDGGTSGGDTIQIFGNFSATSLDYSTITVNDEQGGETVDISGLTSDHRIVFHTDSTGHVVGDVRPQDVVDTSGTGMTGSNGSTSGGTGGTTNHTGNGGSGAGTDNAGLTARTAVRT